MTKDERDQGGSAVSVTNSEGGPTAPTSVSQVNMAFRANPDMLDTLASERPDEFLAFAQQSDQNLLQYNTDRLNLAHKRSMAQLNAEQQRHQIETSNQAEDRRERRQLARLAGIGVFVLILILLLYAGITGKDALVETFLTHILAAAGGAGVKAVYDSSKPDKSQ